VQARIKRDAIEIKKMTPEEFTRFQASELESWGPVAKQLLGKN
jgi:hypothetical protein